MRSMVKAALGLALVAGCGERPEVWSASYERREPLAFDQAAAVLDAPAERVLLMQVDGQLEVKTTSVKVGKNIPLGGAARVDGKRMAVLSRGDVPRRKASDQSPALSLIATDNPGLSARYELSDPLSSLTVDPAARYVVVSASTTDSSFVSNPNELIIADTSAPPSATNPVALTLRSFGGRPERLDFTAPLSLPTGTRRLLVAQTDRDLALLDLADPTRTEVTVRLTSGTTRLQPAGLAVTDGDPARNDDARVAVRLAGDPDVVLIDLLPPEGDAAASGAPFRAVPNIVGVGGVASDLAFVNTDGGLRLATLVPSTRSLVLIEPLTGITSSLALSTSFDRITLVTQELNQADETALLWSTTQSAIAFLSLGKTSEKPYKSIEELPLPEPIAKVLPVPAPFAHRKVLATPGGRSFYVLDMQARSIFPLSSTSASLSLSPDGQRAWAFRAGSPDLAFIDLASAHPRNLLLSLDVDGVADVARTDGGRALLAIHHDGGLSATTLDALNPSLLTSREVSGLSMEGLP